MLLIAANDWLLAALLEFIDDVVNLIRGEDFSTRGVDPQNDRFDILALLGAFELIADILHHAVTCAHVRDDSLDRDDHNFVLGMIVFEHHLFEWRPRRSVGDRPFARDQRGEVGEQAYDKQHQEYQRNDFPHVAAPRRQVPR